MLTLVQTSNKCQISILTKSLEYLSLAELPSFLIYSIPPEKSWLPRYKERAKKTSEMEVALRCTLLTLMTLLTLLTVACIPIYIVKKG